MNKCKNNSRLHFDSKIAFMFSSIILGLLFIGMILLSIDLLGQEPTEKANIMAVRQVIDVINTGDISNVSEFISPQFFDREARVDPIADNQEDLQV
jgi:hypothetical protein